MFQNEMMMDALIAATQACAANDMETLEGILLQDPTVADALLRGNNNLPEDLCCRIALWHYTSHGDELPSIRKYVRKAKCIRPENWRELLPESVRNNEVFTIYRGGSQDLQHVKNSLSWTLERDVAEWFIERNHYRSRFMPVGEQHLYCAEIAAEDVIAYLDERDEFEILQYRKIKNVRELPIQGVSEEFNHILKTLNSFADCEKQSAAKLELFNRRMTDAAAKRDSHEEIA